MTKKTVDDSIKKVLDKTSSEAGIDGADLNSSNIDEAQMAKQLLAKQISEHLVNFDKSAKNAKPGLDIKHGEYRVLGGVTFNQIFTRPSKKNKKGELKKGSNFAKCNGYKVARYAKDDKGELAKDEDGNLIVLETLLISKQEGLMLASLHGMQNAYIDFREKPVKETDQKTGKEEEVAKQSNVYLTPYPRTEAFFQDDRAIAAYKFTAGGKLEYPLHIMLHKNECSPKLWRALQDDYQKRSQKNPKATRKNQENTQHLDAIKTTIINLNLDNGLENPFSGAGTF